MFCRTDILFQYIPTEKNSPIRFMCPTHCVDLFYKTNKKLIIKRVMEFDTLNNRIVMYKKKIFNLYLFTLKEYSCHLSD